MLVSLALLAGIGLVSTDASTCSGWQNRLADGLLSLREKYPELSAFDPRSSVGQRAERSSWVVEYGRDVELRPDLPRPFPKMVLKGPRAVWFQILFKPTVEVEEGNTSLGVGWFDGQICESSYRVTVRSADADRETSIASDIAAVLRGLQADTSSAQRSAASRPADRGETTEVVRKVPVCAVVASSAREQWKKAVDGDERTGWCPSRADRKRELTVRFCDPIAPSRVWLETDLGPMAFTGGSDAAAELTLDQLVVPLGSAGQVASNKAGILPGRDRRFFSFTVTLPRTKRKGARCLMELGFDLADQEVVWP
jgi:hypothetical protein